MGFHVKMEIDENRVRNLLCSALEGGSNYWIDSISYRLGEGLRIADFQKPQGKYYQEDFHHSQLIPFHPDCAVLVLEYEEETPKELTLEKMKKGLQLMQEKSPHHFVDFIKENDDAITADVFLQYSLFGELVYG